MSHPDTHTPSFDTLPSQEPMDDAATPAQGAASGEHENEDASEEASFDHLGLAPALTRALADAGYTSPTRVQLEAIPAALDGADLMVASSTGSGKTAAFMLPALQRIATARGDNSKRREKGKVQGPRALVLAPTRELALQVAKAAVTYGRHLQGLRVATVVGGVPYGAQLKALKGPLDVLIATPGRLLDHLGTGAAVLSNLDMLVLDEADRMLDMGFIDDIEAIAAATPEHRQTLMFSATFAGDVGHLAQRLTHNAARIEVASHTDSHDNIEQRLHLADTLSHKNNLLDHLLNDRGVDQAVVFTSTQRDADVLADRLADMGHAVAALHGGMPQGRRNRVLQALRNRQLRVLVATDVAARGIDVPTITHVINYGMPMKAEDYVHRIGRTGRAGRSGLAVTLIERRDIPMLRRIERFTTQRIPEATIAGLEPQFKLQADKGPRHGHGKPMPGQRRRDAREGHDHRERRDHTFGARAPHGGAPREERAYTPRPQGPRSRDHDPRFEGQSAYGARHEQRGDRSQERPYGQGSDRKDPAAFGGERRAYGAGHGQDRGHGRPQSRHDAHTGWSGERADKPQGGGKFFGDNKGAPRHGSAHGNAGRHGEERAFGEKRFGGDKPSFGDKPFGHKPYGSKPGFKSGPKQGQGFGGKRQGGFGRREG